MAAFAVGDVVLVRFPFSDLTAAKLRPALILTDAGYDDYLLCQITSNPYADGDAIEILDRSFTRGGLSRPSYARPAKLFTANAQLISGIAGSLSATTHCQIVETIERLPRRDMPR